MIRSSKSPEELNKFAEEYGEGYDTAMETENKPEDHVEYEF